MRDADLFQQLLAWLQRGEVAWLCTVLETWGSSPRPRGSLLACTAGGEVIGSLSGGCVEEDLLARIAAGQFAHEVSRWRYGATAEDAQRLRLPCGGVLDIAIERLEPTPVTRKTLSAIADALAARQRLLWDRHYPGGYFTLGDVGQGMPLLSVREGRQGELLRIAQSLGPQYRLLLLGVSEVSRAVAQLGLLLDYEVWVCDPRADARQRWDVDGVTVLPQLPDDAVRQHGDDPHCAILALTHDPRIDDMGLMEAFATRAFYIGAMGSSRTSHKRRERLLTLDVTEQQLQRLHAPIGLDTGSKTPMEIAVSVMAQLTAVRSGRHA